ncbi:MarR family winged helix-turn-helix transcriptional regulator [Goodfellowiella coeruleoviolacea]|uniref:DNA-binding transcriptional regulator, MarR family n=1 Tax=Goodfellowiella coeruleoviolacea TaxID=334858 RepID=A0AAE3GBI0_9PSEU|nr:MarR family transcriptional regulator [Goodfellowiella coeruleoviolacea]MCP2164039.1 DNA-binding transcriptional regulator, MarR family [Goodfellowiella coeruleoviolacea]
MTAEPHQPADTEEDPAPLTLYLVKRLELVIRALLDERLRELGLTTPQYTALSVLHRRSPLSSAQLARRSFVRPQSMHEMVLALEERGLIERHRDAGNRRVLLARLTQQGEELLARCQPVVAELESHLLGGMGPRRRAEFRRMLDHGYRSLAGLAHDALPIE